MREHSGSGEGGEPVDLSKAAPRQSEQSTFQQPGEEPSYGHVHPPPGQPGYEQPGFQQPGFQQPGFQQPGFQQPGYQQPGNQQPGFQQPGNQQPGNQQSGYQQSPHGQTPFQQSPYQQPGYEQSPYGQPGYQQSGYPQPGDPQFAAGAHPSPPRRKVWPWVTAAVVGAVLLLGGIGTAGYLAIRNTQLVQTSPDPTPGPVGSATSGPTSPDPTLAGGPQTADQLAQWQSEHYAQVLAAIEAAKLTNITRVYLDAQDDVASVEASGKGYLLTDGSLVEQAWVIEDGDTFDATAVPATDFTRVNTALLSGLPANYTARGQVDVLSYRAGTTTMVASAQDLASEQSAADGRCTYVEIAAYLVVGGGVTVEEPRRGLARECLR